MDEFPPQQWRAAPARPVVPTVAGGQGALDDVELFPVPAPGPEDVLLDDDGAVWTGLEDGRIVRVPVDGGPVETIADTGGRPLGLEWLPDGDLLVCDADRGLLRVARDGGAVAVMTAEVDGRPLVLTNNAAVEPDGTVWFTESSRVFPLERYMEDLLQHNCSGRLLRRDPTGEVTEVLDGLAFANGVAVVGDEVWVAETGSCAIHRVLRTGPRAGVAILLTDSLPGYPDNLSVGADGTVWAPLPNGRLASAEALLALPPWVRDVADRLPESMKPAPVQHAEVVGFAPDGSVRHHLTGRGAACTFLTGAREHEGWLYLGSQSPHVTAVARVRVPTG